ncbi:MAG: elongation factor P [Candidatus Omnitrophica bacterium]|nr:elongation factor P [Candidatus Omnitrophota bacterium]
MISTNQFKNGMTIMLDGDIYSIVGFQHVKPGKGGAFVRTKLRNLKSGNILDKTFRAGEKVEQAFLEERRIQFLYRHGNFYHFMDQKSFEEVELSEKRLGEKVKFLKENTELAMVMCEGKIIDINLPNFVELKVIHAEPGVRADTVKAATKRATIETGAKIDVPLFINKGQIIKIDTRSERYVGRA